MVKVNPASCSWIDKGRFMASKDSKTKSTSSNEDQRQHYRIRYPLQERPAFECMGKKYMILDVSEKGLAFRIEEKDPITKATSELKGRIAFKSGDVVNIAGKILRHADNTVILIMQTGIPLAVMMKEQRFLIQKYGQIRG